MLIDILALIFILSIISIMITLIVNPKIKRIVIYLWFWKIKGNHGITFYDEELGQYGYWRFRKFSDVISWVKYTSNGEISEA